MPRTPTTSPPAGSPRTRRRWLPMVTPRALRLAALALLGACALALLLRDPDGDGQAERQALREQLQRSAAALARWQAEPAAPGLEEYQNQKRARSQLADPDLRVMQWPVQLLLQEAGQPMPGFRPALQPDALLITERLAVPGRWGWTLHARMDVLPMLLAPPPWWQRHALPLAGGLLGLALLGLATWRQRVLARQAAPGSALPDQPPEASPPSLAQQAQQGLLTLNGVGGLGARAASAAHAAAEEMEAHACLRQQLHEQSEQLAWLTEQMKRRRGAPAGEEA